MSATQDRASRYVWNPMSRMADVLGSQRVWVRGEGSVLFDETGNEFIDGCGSLWYQIVGYGRDEIVEAVASQMKLLPSWMLFGNNVTTPTVDLAERLAHLTPADLNRIFFTSGGSESVEAAFKIVRQYFRLFGQPGRYKILARHGSYHGSTLGALSATGTTHSRRMFEPLVPGFRHVPPFSIEMLEQTIAFEGPETIAAFIIDPAMVASGVRLPPDDYLPQVRDLCNRHGILLISDEVVSGFGRIGEWFGMNRWGVVPDLITMAKGISSGYVPLGAVAVSDRVFEPFVSQKDPDNAFFHGYTYSGHAACCAAGLANISIIESEGLLERSVTEGRYLYGELRSLADEFEIISEVTGGIGLAVGIHLASSAQTGIAQLIAEAAYERGALVRALTGNIVTLSPPLVIARSEIDRLCEALRSSLAALSLRRDREPEVVRR